jgi:hypothetical protein
MVDIRYEAQSLTFMSRATSPSLVRKTVFLATIRGRTLRVILEILAVVAPVSADFLLSDQQFEDWLVRIFL